MKNNSTKIGFIFIVISVGLFLYRYLKGPVNIEPISFESFFIGGFGVAGIISVLGKFNWIDRIIDHKFPKKK